MTAQRSGELFVLAETLLWSWFPVVSILSYAYLPPLWSLTLAIGVAALFFAGVLTVKKRWKEVKASWRSMDIFLSAFFIALLYIFLFTGLEYTTAGNGAVILFLHVLFSYLFFNLWKKEAMDGVHKWGVALMSLGAVTILFPGTAAVNPGDGLVLLAAVCAPLANYFMQKARKAVSAETLLLVRSLLSLPFLIALALVLERPPEWEKAAGAVPYLLVNGVLLLGLSKILWIEAIHRISVTKAAAMTALGPAFTLAIAFWVLGETPGLWQLVGVVPVLAGGVLITRKGQKASGEGR